MGSSRRFGRQIIELDQVDVEVAVLETYVPNLRLAAEASVEVVALGKKPFIGKSPRSIRWATNELAISPFAFGCKTRWLKTTSR